MNTQGTSEVKLDFNRVSCRGLLKSDRVHRTAGMKHYVKCKKSVIKGHIVVIPLPQDVQNRQITEIESRVNVSRDWEG